jgi:putative exporter of polyketide antibiotics
MSYSDPPPPPPQYGAPQPPYGDYPQKTNTKAVWALVLGILSIVCCGLVAGIPAIILGNLAKKEIETTGQPGRGMAQAGFILGIISIAFSVITLVLYATGTLSGSGSGT